MTAASGSPSTAPPPTGPRVKDAALAALVALVLALPLVGLQTVDIGGGALGIRTRFDWVAIGGGAVFVGAAAAAAAARGSAVRGRRAAQARSHRLAAWGSRQVCRSRSLGIGFAVALPFLPFSSRYVVDLGTTVLIYVMLGWGLNVVVGLAGLLDLGYVAFYAVGAYSFALLARDLGLHLLGGAAVRRACSPRSSASCWAFRCCACAATISRSSRSASARSSASCC